MLLLTACFCTFATMPLLLGILPASFANTHVVRLRKLLECWSIMAVFAAVSAFLISVVSSPTTVRAGWMPDNSAFQFTLLVDTVSSLMWTLVSAVGWVICRYSVRYLDGDQNQGRYFKWVGFTLSAVSLTVLSANLFLMVVGYLCISVGLHRLLLHHANRASARFPAVLKFLFSRIGDLCLVGAAVVLYREFGSANLPDIFAGINANAAVSSGVATSAALIAACAILKSAQFPFHSWLPETMEAPTPVSALMHAGIVNAGGYLLIRSAPIVSAAPAVLWAVAGIGAFTAFFAAMTMQMQTSVKRTLAWSTIAQMGFMMLQCGLGAFSAAMLHIIAHSLYKAHAFLNSGSVLVEKKATGSVAQSSPSGLQATAKIFGSVVIASGVAGLLCWLFGISPESKPGGLILGLVLLLSVVRWIALLLEKGWKWSLAAAGFSAGLFAAYLTGFSLVDTALTLAASRVPAIALSPWLIGTIGVLVTIVFMLETVVRHATQSRWYQALYVHGGNGFYVDAFWKQLARNAAR